MKGCRGQIEARMDKATVYPLGRAVVTLKLANVLALQLSPLYIIKYAFENSFPQQIYAYVLFSGIFI